MNKFHSKIKLRDYHGSVQRRFKTVHKATTAFLVVWNSRHATAAPVKPFPPSSHCAQPAANARGSHGHSVLACNCFHSPTRFSLIFYRAARDSSSMSVPDGKRKRKTLDMKAAMIKAITSGMKLSEPLFASERCISVQLRTSLQLSLFNMRVTYLELR